MIERSLGAILCLGVALFASPALANCAPETSVRESVEMMRKEMTVKELTAAEREEFNRVVNEAPPASDTPTPNTIILIETPGGREFLIYTHPQDITQLCLLGPIANGSIFKNLFQRYLGARASAGV